MQAVPAKIVFVMPRCRHDHVRGVHKQAWSLSNAGYEVLLVVKEDAVKEYLGMPVIRAHAPFNSILRPLLNMPPLLLQLLRLRGDLYFLRNPDTMFLALFLRLFRRNVIYDTQEDFSKRPLIRDQLPAWLRPIFARLITVIERMLARTAAGVIVTQQHQSKLLGGDPLFQPNAPLVRGPVVTASQMSLAEKSMDTVALVYAGGIEPRRGIFTMLNLLVSLNARMKCKLELMGPFSSEAFLQAAEQHPGWRFVRYHGEVPHSEALARIRNADIGLAILDHVADYPTSSITKLFEYMQAGVAFIASDFPAWRVETPLGAPGIYVDPKSTDEIFSAAIQLCEDENLRRKAGDAGSYYVRNDFNWDLLEESLLEFVGNVVGNQEIAGSHIS